MDLTKWQRRLEQHFAELRTTRTAAVGDVGLTSGRVAFSVGRIRKPPKAPREVVVKIDLTLRSGGAGAENVRIGSEDDRLSLLEPHFRCRELPGRDLGELTKHGVTAGASCRFDRYAPRASSLDYLPAI